MSFKTDLHAKFAATSAITDLTSTRIAQNFAPQAWSTSPRLVYHKISGLTDQHLGGVSGLRRQRYQVDCVAEDSGIAESLAEAVRSTFAAFRGTMGSQSIRHTNADEAPDETPDPGDGSDSRVHVARIELDFWFR